LVEDCCGALTQAEHQGSLHNVRGYFGRVLDSSEIIAHWRAVRVAIPS
jgi:hypothetical protein